MCYSAHVQLRGHPYTKGHAKIRLEFWEGMTMQERLARLPCACTYQILCEVRQEGKRLGILTFFDDGPESETCGQQVMSCPGCGQRLGLHLLQARKTSSL